MLLYTRRNFIHMPPMALKLSKFLSIYTTLMSIISGSAVTKLSSASSQFLPILFSISQNHTEITTSGLFIGFLYVRLWLQTAVLPASYKSWSNTASSCRQLCMVEMFILSLNEKLLYLDQETSPSLSPSHNWFSLSINITGQKNYLPKYFSKLWLKKKKKATSKFEPTNQTLPTQCSNYDQIMHLVAIKFSVSVFH